MAISVDLSKALDKAYENSSLEEILAAPPSALAGVTEADDKALADNLGIKTVRDLGVEQVLRGRRRAGGAVRQDRLSRRSEGATRTPRGGTRRGAAVPGPGDGTGASRGGACTRRMTGTPSPRATACSARRAAIARSLAGCRWSTAAIAGNQHLDGDRRHADDAAHRLEQRHLADEGALGPAPAAGVHIADRGGRDGHGRIHRGPERRAPERIQRVSAARGALREDLHPVSAAQCHGDLRPRSSGRRPPGRTRSTKTAPVLGAQARPIDRPAAATSDVATGPSGAAAASTRTSIQETWLATTRAAPAAAVRAARAGCPAPAQQSRGQRQRVCAALSSPVRGRDTYRGPGRRRRAPRGSASQRIARPAPAAPERDGRQDRRTAPRWHGISAVDRRTQRPSGSSAGLPRKCRRSMPSARSRSSSSRKSAVPNVSSRARAVRRRLRAAAAGSRASSGRERRLVGPRQVDRSAAGPRAGTVGQAGRQMLAPGRDPRRRRRSRPPSDRPIEAQPTRYR